VRFAHSQLERQRKCEGRTLVDFGLRGDLASVPFYDALDDSALPAFAMVRVSEPAASAAERPWSATP
jgi:hypothetical protein